MSFEEATQEEIRRGDAQAHAEAQAQGQGHAQVHIMHKPEHKPEHKSEHDRRSEVEIRARQQEERALFRRSLEVLAQQQVRPSNRVVTAAARPQQQAAVPQAWAIKQLQQHIQHERRHQQQQQQQHPRRWRGSSARQQPQAQAQPYSRPRSSDSGGSGDGRDRARASSGGSSGSSSRPRRFSGLVMMQQDVPVLPLPTKYSALERRVWVPHRLADGSKAVPTPAQHARAPARGSRYLPGVSFVIASANFNDNLPVFNVETRVFTAQEDPSPPASGPGRTSGNKLIRAHASDAGFEPHTHTLTNGIPDKGAGAATNGGMGVTFSVEPQQQLFVIRSQPAGSASGFEAESGAERRAAVVQPVPTAQWHNRASRVEPRW